MTKQMSSPEHASGTHISLTRNRNYLALVTGGTVSSLGTAMSLFLFPVVGYTVTGSLGFAATLSTLYSLGRLVLRLPSGVLVDRWNRRNILVWANLAAGAPYALLSWSLGLDAGVRPALAIVAVLTGVATTLIDPAEIALMRECIAPDQLPTAMSQLEARSHGVELVGAPLGGLLLPLGVAVPFLLDAASYAVAFVAALVVRVSRPHRRPEAPSGLWGSMLEGLRFVWSHGFFRATMVYSALANLTVGALLVAITLNLVSNGVSAAQVGAIYTAMGIAGLVGAMLAPFFMSRVPAGVLSISATWLLALGVVPCSLTDNPFLVGACLGLCFLVLPSATTATMSYTFSITPPDFQGRAGSALGFVGGVASPLGPALAAWLLTQLGAEPTILVVGVLIALSAVPLLLSSELRTLGTPDRWAPSETS